MADASPTITETHQQTPDMGDWVDEDDLGDDEDDDIAAEAEKMTRRLGAELWADITKANAQREAANMLTAPATSAQSEPQIVSAVPHIPIFQNTFAGKVNAALATMRLILSYAEKDAAAHNTLLSTVVHELNGDNVLHILQNTISSGSINKQTAAHLSQVFISLGKSDILFAGTRNHLTAFPSGDLGKRKRVDGEDDFRIFKRPFLPDTELQHHLTEAVHIISQAVGTTATRNLDPVLVGSIRLQLHQVFLFAVTSSAGGGSPEMNALQEISGLIQVIGVLSGIQIGQNLDRAQALPAPGMDPWVVGALGPDIGTAVYPCLMPNCRKIFSRLYSLRAHQRIHATHRPFRCNACPASFARNHDLKRHLKLHDKTAWKCCGCQKVFSRRDAIKRHKDGNKARGLRNEACADSEVLEVQLDEGEREELAVREERRAKLWNGIAVNEANAAMGLSYRGFGEDGTPEEGEIQPSVITTIQSTILSLHGLLQAHVGHALGTSQPGTHSIDPTGGQATLASVIARAQMMSMPSTMSPVTEIPSIPHHDSSIPQALEASATTSNESNMGLDTNTIPSLSLYGLSDEQTKLLEQAIASAASTAQALAEAEAAMEEEEDEFDMEEDEESEQRGGPENLNTQTN